MTYTVTAAHLLVLDPKAQRPAEFAAALTETAEKFDITDRRTLSAFLANVVHETGGFRQLSENLNYSVDGLMKTWPSRFKTRELATKYARKPQAIANFVYANRMGNGDEASGDGWKHRGMGLIQLTGKNNHRACGLYLGLDLVNKPELLLEPEAACLSAGWYWMVNNLNAPLYAADFDKVCDVINIGRTTPKVGDSIGYAHRLDLYKKALNLYK